MSDKSPRQSSSQKSTKTLKQKRQEKKALANEKQHPTVMPTGRHAK